MCKPPGSHCQSVWNQKHNSGYAAAPNRLCAAAAGPAEEFCRPAGNASGWTSVTGSVLRMRSLERSQVCREGVQIKLSSVEFDRVTCLDILISKCFFLLH